MNVLSCGPCNTKQMLSTRGIQANRSPPFCPIDQEAKPYSVGLKKTPEDATARLKKRESLHRLDRIISFNDPTE